MLPYICSSVHFFTPKLVYSVVRGSVVSIATSYRLDDRKARVRVPVKYRGSFSG
jgi:hypothetical protein